MSRKRNRTYRKKELRNKSARRRSNKAVLGYESLEERQLLAADLSFGTIEIFDGNNNNISSPEVGEEMQIRVNYNTTDLPAGAEYRITGEYHGYPLESEVLTTGAGQASASGEYVFGGWYTTANAEDITFTLDSGFTVTEDDESNNVATRSIDASRVNRAAFSNAAINDNTTTTSTLEVFDTGTIDDLNVLLQISHTYDADLDVFLTSPAGTTVELFTDVGGDGDNFFATSLDDEAATSITNGTAPFLGAFRPEGMLADFDGESITGTWTLEVTDDAGGDTGTLAFWTIDAQVTSEFSSKLAWPVGAEAFTEIGIYGYVDVDPNSNAFDFTGRRAARPGSEGMLINDFALSTMDQGVQVLAAATGTIAEVHDGENDRFINPNTGPANYVVIDHGDGWQTRYTHLRRDSIQVNVGDMVSQGDVIALMGSGNEAFGAPGINFQLTHHGRPVESMMDPGTYQLAGEFPYVFDADPAVYSASLAGQATISIIREGPSSSSTFKVGNLVHHAYSFGSWESGDVIVNRFIDPSGNVADSHTFTSGADNTLGHSSFSTTVNALGTWKAETLVNGVLQNSIEFEVTANGVPEIRIDDGPAQNNITHVRDGRHTPIDFGTTQFSSDATTNIEKTFTVTNHGGMDLDISGVEVPFGFSLVEGLPSTLAPGASDDFTIALESDWTGARLGQVRVFSNDADESVYNFPVEGFVADVLQRVDFGLSHNQSPEGTEIWGNLVRPSFDPDAATFSIQVILGDTTEVTIPTQVTIPAGESTVRFPISVNYHEFLHDGDQQITIVATDSGANHVYAGSLAELTTTDIDDRFETGGNSNNSLATPTDLGVIVGRFEPGLSLTNTSGTQAPNDSDYFSFVADATGQATVDLTFVHEQSDIDLQIFDSDDNSIAISGSTSDNESATFDVVAGETYKIRVYGFTGGLFNPYDLGVAIRSLAVTTTDDVVDAYDNATSLREAISYANDKPGSDQIMFAPSLPGTIVLNHSGDADGSPDIDITEGITIFGPGADTLTISGNNNSRIFDITGAIDVTIAGLTLTGGSESDSGGAIRAAEEVGKLTVTGSVFENNSSNGSGGAIFMDGFTPGDLEIALSTFNDNTSSNGGAVYTLGSLVVTNSTFVRNSAGAGTGAGGAVFASSGSIRHATIVDNAGIGGLVAGGSSGLGVFDSIIAGNVDMSSGSPVPNDINGPLNAASAHNIVGSDSISTNGGLTDGVDGNQVGVDWKTVVANDGTTVTLADNGGHTPTVALALGSSAIDAGSSTVHLSNDQRGEARPFDGDNNGSSIVDIGAYERTDVVAPEIESVVINGGDDQRSMVREIELTFSEAVNVDANSFMLENTDEGVCIVPDVATAVVGGKTVATLTFSGAGIVGGSLADGNYTLTTFGTVADLAGNPLDGGDATDNFFRLYGDDDGNRIVNVFDLLDFRQAYSSATGDSNYNADLDFSNNGQINIFDLLEFRKRYGTSI